MKYFEDIEVGAKASFGSYHLSRKEALDFAEKYDPQPFHLSDEAAAKTHFGRLAASGWQTCAIAMRMMVDHIKANPQANLGASGVEELRWLKPVFPGDTLRGEYELLEKIPSAKDPGRGSMRSRMTVFNQHDEPVMTYVARVLIRRRPVD